MSKLLLSKSSLWLQALTKVIWLPCLLVLLGLFPLAAQGQTDTTRPSASITTPTSSAYLATLNGGISGTATDTGSGVASMVVYLTRDWPNVTAPFWNGTGWQSSAFNLSTQLGTANGAGTKTWTVTTPLPQGSDFVAGRYTLTATAIDGVNLTSPQVSIHLYSGTDTTAPAITLDSPAPNSAFNPDQLPTTLSGTVQDPANSDGTPGSGITSATVALTRSWNGTTEVWNPTTSSWDSGSTPVAAALGTPDANGVITWSASLSIPAASLPPGFYTYSIHAYDRSNLNGAFYANVQILPIDTTAPQASLTDPAPNSTLTQLPSVLSGLAWDPAAADGTPGSGPSRLIVSLRRSWGPSPEYWTGIVWGGNSSFQATLGTPDANGQLPWTFGSANLPSGGNLPSGANLPAGNYSVTLGVRDRYGNNSTSTVPFAVGPADSTAPTIAISTPGDGTTLYSQNLSSLSGTASDGSDGTGSGVVWVRVSLKRVVSGTTQYWNGSSWSTSSGSSLNATLGTPDTNGTLTWSQTSSLPSGTNLPVGSYTLTALAYDRYNNGSTTATSSFTVSQDSTAPTVSIASPSEGEALLSLPSITGSASDNDNGSGVAHVDVQLGRTMSQPGGGTSTEYWNGTAWSTTSALLPTATETSWVRNTNLPSGASLPFGDYFVVAQAFDNVGNASASITHHFSIVPSLDAMIAAGEDTAATPLAQSAYIGEYIINQDAINQDASASGGAGAPIDFSVKVHKYGGSDDVTFTAPALDNGWSAAYYDANGMDITSAVTGTGWVHAMLDNEEAIITVEVTPPTGAAIGDSRDVLIQASASGQEDVVKATATVRAAAIPDISLRRITDTQEQGATDGNWTGEGVVGSIGTGNERLSIVTGADQTEEYEVRVKNIGAAPGRFTLHLTTPPSGWTLHLFTSDGTEITSQAHGGWLLPELGVGESLLLDLQAVCADGTTTPMDTDLSADGDGHDDSAGVNELVQYIDHLEWSPGDGQWYPVLAATLINSQRYGTIGLRAIKGLPEAPWPGEGSLGPKWKAPSGALLEGEEIWAGWDRDDHPDGQVEARATCGHDPMGQNAKHVTLHFLDDVFPTAILESGEASVEADATQTSAVGVTVHVVDEDDNPLVGAKVRIKASTIAATGTLTSQWNSTTDAAEITATTDANGDAHVSWTGLLDDATFRPQVLLDVDVLDGADQSFGYSDQVQINVVNADVETTDNGGDGGNTDNGDNGDNGGGG